MVQIMQRRLANLVSGQKQYCVFCNLLNELSQTARRVVLKFVVGYRVDNPSPQRKN
jgi:hypothetical protein